MPIQAPQWTDYLNCPACCREFAPSRSPISLGCGHTLCRICLKNLHRKQCPFDQTVISVDLEELVVNTALLQLAGYTPPAQPYHPPCIKTLSEQDRQAYDVVVKSLEQLAVFLKYSATNNASGCRLSRPMQRKLVTLLQCAMTDEEGRGKAARAARSLGDRTVTELLVQHQNPQQLSANLWAAVRSRGCQFLGPAMQEEVLKLVLLALEDGSALSRKVLVMFVVQRLEPHFPQASKTSIGHVVQLLYRASCFKLSKRVCDSSLMQLKDEFRSYDSLRREHDAQIVQIATEAGLRIAPDQWSALLYGDTQHKSHMQSIIDKLQTPQSFAQSVQELFITLQRTRDPAQLISMSIPLDRLANIDSSPDAKSPSWQQLSAIMTALKEVISGLVHFMQHHTTSRDSNHNSKIMDRLPEQPNQQTAMQGMPGRYKVAMCRDLQNRVYCPRGNNCTYAHSEEELERYRRNNPAVHNGNYQFLMQPPVITVPHPIYQNFSVPPPPLPNMEHNFNMPPMQQQISPTARRPMVGVDAMNLEQPYEHHDSENVYELGRGRDNPFEHHEPPCDSSESYDEQSYEPYDRRDQTSYERVRDLSSYDRRDQSYDLLPNVSYAEALMQGSEGAARSGMPNQSTPIPHQNGNANSIMPPAGRHYSRYVKRPAYTFMPRIDTGRVSGNDKMTQFPSMSGSEPAQAHARDYPKPPYNDNGPELHFESLTYGMAVPRPMAIIQPMESAWPTNAVKCPPMFQFDKRAKNLPLGMEMGKSIPMNMDIGKNIPIGRDLGSNMPLGMDLCNNMPMGLEMGSNMPIGLDLPNNMPIGMDLPIGLPQTNGDMIHHGLEGVRIKPKIRTANEKRDDQELEKELKALEKRISTEL